MCWANLASPVSSCWEGQDNLEWWVSTMETLSICKVSVQQGDRMTMSNMYLMLGAFGPGKARGCLRSFYPLPQQLCIAPNRPLEWPAKLLIVNWNLSHLQPLKCTDGLWVCLQSWLVQTMQAGDNLLRACCFYEQTSNQTHWTFALSRSKGVIAMSSKFSCTLISLQPNF